MMARSVMISSLIETARFRKGTAMKDDLVTLSTARRLRNAGLSWSPEPGDWCVPLGGLTEAQSGFWLVLMVDSEPLGVTLADVSGVWPATRIAANEGLWLPTGGQLKSWLRMRGYRLTTIEASPAAPQPHTPAAPQPHTPAAPQTRPKATGWASGIIKPPPETLEERLGAPSHAIFTHQCQAQYTDGTTLQSEGTTEAEAVAEVAITILMRPRPPQPTERTSLF